MPKHSNKDNLLVVYEDNHIIAVNKRPGDIVQGDKTGDKPLSEVVKSYIKVRYKKPGNVFLGVVHRLDRPTSGIVVFARTSKALTRLNESFKKQEVDKYYWAVVEGSPEKESGKLSHWLLKNQKQNKSYPVAQKTHGAKEAILEYNLHKLLDNYALLEVKLFTGRHHQIRVQMADTGHPIKGDLKYGAKRSNKDGSIHLHARKLILTHPVTKEELELIAEPPNDPVWNSCL